MSHKKPNHSGGYDYIPNIATYSGGAVARPGFEIVRVEFSEILPLSTGFKAISDLINEADRPLQSLCGIELRSPAPFSYEEFRSFNQSYLGQLDQMGIVLEGDSPVARTNAVPLYDAPGEVGILAFHFTTVHDASDWARTFVLSGTAEGSESDPSDIVSPGGTDEAAQISKAKRVISVLNDRRTKLGCQEDEATRTNLYSSLELKRSVDQLIATGLSSSSASGFHNFLAAPPVEAWYFEMDARRVFRETYR